MTAPVKSLAVRDVRLTDIPGVPASVRAVLAARGLVWLTELLTAVTRDVYADQHRPAGIIWLWSDCVLLYTACLDAETAIDQAVDRVMLATDGGAP